MSVFLSLRFACCPVVDAVTAYMSYILLLSLKAESTDISIILPIYCFHQQLNYNMRKAGYNATLDRHTYVHRRNHF